MYTESELEVLGASRTDYKKHLDEFPDDTWEEYLEGLEYAHDAQKEKLKWQ